MDRSININPDILEAELEGAKNNINIIIKIMLFMAIIMVFLKNIKNGEWVLTAKIYNFRINLGN